MDTMLHQTEPLATVEPLDPIDEALALRWRRHDGITSLRWSAESITRRYLVYETRSGATLRVLRLPGHELLDSRHLATGEQAVDQAEALHRRECQ